MSMAIPAHAEWPSNYDLELWPSNSKPLAELPAEICLTQKNTMSWSAVKIVSESGTGTITLTGPNGLNETLTVRSSDIGTYGDNEDYGIKITLPQAYTAEGTYTLSATTPSIPIPAHIRQGSSAVSSPSASALSRQ